MDSDVEVARARLGRKVGDHWVLERVLGTGGMGAVYAARASDGSVAAVKILHPEMGARREVRERFLREGSAAEKIGHPGVVRVLGQGDGEEAFLVMELLEGETLRDRVRRHGRLPLEEVLDFAEQVLDVLVVAHERGVVHRDLKPDNLWVTVDRRIKMLDFGLARLLDGVPGKHQTRTGVALGTLAYMAPEQALGRRGEIDGRVDLFALGATMFRVLSGRRVHEAESEAELLMAMASRPAPPLVSVAPETPELTAAVVDLALAFSRDARYPDASTMRADVRALRQGAVPSFAAERFASRSESTRADRPAYSQRTQPLGAVPPPASQRTVPLAAYTEATVPSVPSVRAPVALRTEPLQARAPSVSATLPAAPSPAAPSPAAFTPGFVSAAPPAAMTPGVTAPPPKGMSRGVLALLVVLGTLAVASIGGAVAYFALVEDDERESSNEALPAPLPGREPTAAPAVANGAGALRRLPSAGGEPRAAAQSKALAEPTTPKPGPALKPAASPSASTTPEAKASGSPTASTTGAAAPTAPPAPAPAPAPTTTTTGSAAPPAPPTPSSETAPPPSPDGSAPSRPRRSRGRPPRG